MITLETAYWNKNLRPRLVEEFGPSILISFVCKSKLGFTVRKHQAWIDNKNYKTELANYEKYMADSKAGYDLLLGAPPHKGHTKHVICLDFYNDVQETWFRLRYL